MITTIYGNYKTIIIKPELKSLDFSIINCGTQKQKHSGIIL